MKPKTRKIDMNGRISIPKDFLEEIGISPGEEVFIKTDNGVLMISDVYLPEWGLKDRNDILKKIEKSEISGRSKPIKKKRSPGKRRSPAIQTQKFNDKWAYEERLKNRSLSDMKAEYENEMNIEINRSSLSRWVSRYKKDNNIKD